MSFRAIPLGLLAGVLTACSSVGHKPVAQEDSLAKFQKLAAKYNNVITVPSFETTTDEVRASVRKAVADGNAALDSIGKLSTREVTFGNTVGALDDLGFQLGLVDNRLSLIKETSTNSAVRDAATVAVKEFEEWMVGLDYREDVYRAVKAYADTKPALEGEDAKLLFETMRDYRRAGLGLPRAERDEAERMRKELSRLETDYATNLTKAEKALKFTKAELDGVPGDFLKQIKTGDDEYTVMANITWHYLTVIDNAKREDTRKQIYIAYCSLANETNVPVLEKIVPLRDDIAKKLGYRTWADYQTEVKMVKTAAAATKFLEDLKTGLQPKFDAEFEEFRQIKIRQTGDANAKMNVWDWRYFSNQLKKDKYNVDAEQLRVYFPYQRVLDGMFAIYQRIFGLNFERVESPYKWVGDLQLYAVSDAQSGEPLGLFYLDMFPREGKYHHFAQFGIVDGKLLSNGKYQRPTCALICNFPPPQPDKPSLLSHDDVETLFHEFGHAMHTLMTRAKYSRFSGTSVPRDFVEAPSQMLENWVWDKKVLDSFAADYRDPSKKIPEGTLSDLKKAKLATEGTRYRRQISYGLMDMALHTQIHDDNAQDVVKLSNRVLSESFPPAPENTALVAYFDQIIGYSAGYYGYAWADSIAADMATEFEKSPDGYFNKEAGMRLRREIYEPGNSRDVNISIEKFLGRPRSIEPFLKKIGIEKEWEEND